MRDLRELIEAAVFNTTGKRTGPFGSEQITEVVMRIVNDRACQCTAQARHPECPIHEPEEGWPEQCGVESSTGLPCNEPKGHKGRHRHMKDAHSGWWWEQCKAKRVLGGSQCLLEDDHDGDHDYQAGRARCETNIVGPTVRQRCTLPRGHSEGHTFETMEGSAPEQQREEEREAQEEEVQEGMREDDGREWWTELRRRIDRRHSPLNPHAAPQDAVTLLMDSVEDGKHEAEEEAEDLGKADGREWWTELQRNMGGRDKAAFPSLLPCDVLHLMLSIEEGKPLGIFRREEPEPLWDHGCVERCIYKSGRDCPERRVASQVESTEENEHRQSAEETSVATGARPPRGTSPNTEGQDVADKLDEMAACASKLIHVARDAGAAERDREWAAHMKTHEHLGTGTRIECIGCEWLSDGGSGTPEDNHGK